MRKIWKLIGIFLFWLLWPAWFIYFRVFPRRTRVLVVWDHKILLVRGWLSNNRYSLPGGGAHRYEDLALAATRELKEETGIEILPAALRKIGTKKITKYGLNYKATYFSVELSSQPILIAARYEISELFWADKKQLKTLKLSPGTIYAINSYQAPEQATLL
jgi:8-oxo-dGTP diphosphatase